MRNRLVSLTAIALAGLAMTSCKDDAWDLNNIDKLFGINNDITMPLCSTGDIIMRNFMKLDEDSNVKIIRNYASTEETDSTFEVTSSGEGDLIFNEVPYGGGIIYVPVVHVDPVMLDNMPDFLRDPDVVLDIYNPMIILTVTNNTPMDVTTKMVLSSYMENGVMINEHTSDVLVLPAEKTTKFVLAEKNDLRYLSPEQKKDAIYCYVSNLGQLIKKIPDYVELDFVDITFDSQVMTPTSERTLNFEYELAAPLALGKDFQMVYSDVEDEMNLGDDLDKLQTNDAYIRIISDATNNIPADALISVEFLNAEGESLNDFISVDPFNVKDYNSMGIKIEAKPTKGHSLSEILSSVDAYGQPNPNQMDGIRYKAVIKKPHEENVALPSNAYIKLSNVRISICGGVVYDAN